MYAYACGQFSSQRCEVDISKVEDHERIRSLELKLFARSCSAAFPHIVAVNGENELFNLEHKDAILLGNDDDHVFGRGNFESVERLGDDNPAFVYEGGVGGFDDSYQSSVEIRRLKLLQPSFLVMVAEPRSIRGYDRSRFLVFFLCR